MKTFEFSVVASGLDPEAEGFADRFFEAGCDDATVGFQKGRIILDFARDAACLDEAIASAVAAVTAAGAKVDRVEPDPLVSLSDIAARTGMSRVGSPMIACAGRTLPSSTSFLAPRHPTSSSALAMMCNGFGSSGVEAAAAIAAAMNAFVSAAPRPTSRSP